MTLCLRHMPYVRAPCPSLCPCLDRVAAEASQKMYIEADKALKKAERVIGKSKKLKETKSIVDKQDEEISELKAQNDVSYRAHLSTCVDSGTILATHTFERSELRGDGSRMSSGVWLISVPSFFYYCFCFCHETSLTFAL